MQPNCQVALKANAHNRQTHTRFSIQNTFFLLLPMIFLLPGVFPLLRKCSSIFFIVFMNQVEFSQLIEDDWRMASVDIKFLRLFEKKKQQQHLDGFLSIVLCSAVAFITHLDHSTVWFCYWFFRLHCRYTYIHSLCRWIFFFCPTPFYSITRFLHYLNGTTQRVVRIAFWRSKKPLRM